MGPPTISADQLYIITQTNHKRLWLQWGRRRSRRINARARRRGGPVAWGFNGAADDLGGSTSARGLNRGCCPTMASMGPPTISADQPRHVVSTAGAVQLWLQWGRRRSRRINLVNYQTNLSSSGSLQWGRRRSRRINTAAPKADTTWDNRPRFNGAADDLGGSTTTRRSRWPSNGSCFNGAADDLGGSTIIHVSKITMIFQLQWGRRRSRRINLSSTFKAYEGYAASMGPPTISADQRARCADTSRCL